MARLAARGLQKDPVTGKIVPIPGLDEDIRANLLINKELSGNTSLTKDDSCGIIINGNRADADDNKDNWITVKNGEHVLLGEGNEIESGLGGKFTGQKPEEAFGNKPSDAAGETTLLEDPGKGSSGETSDPGKKQHHSAIKKRLKTAEDEIRKLPHERAHIIDRDGNIVSTIDGTNKDVNIPSDIKGLTVTHNHPSGSTFSRQDIFTFVKGQPYEIRAASPQGTTYSLKLKENKVDPKMKDDFVRDKVQDLPRIDTVIAERVRKGEYTRQYADKNQQALRRELANERTRDWLSKNAKKYGCVYSEEG